MSNPYLLLWFEGPLQSWGFDSKFGRRDTLSFPTKSGVLGLLCCALGAGGEQRELLAALAPLRQTVLSFVRLDQDKNKIERQPLLRDFHMVGSGYDDTNYWENLLIPKTSEGKKPNGSGAKMTYRYYLQDAFFAVIMESPADKANDFVQALENPVWDLYLGRKNCVPTDFIYRGRFIREENAIEQALHLAIEKNLTEDFRVLDGEHLGEVLLLNDVPLQFGERKLYRERRVTVITA